MPKYSTFKASKIAIIGAIETHLNHLKHLWCSSVKKFANNLRSDGGQRVWVREWISHPNYHIITFYDNDFAILKLSRWAVIGRYNAELWLDGIMHAELWLVRSHVSFSALVSPACLPSSALNNYDDVQAEVTGWGRLSHGGTSPDKLQKVKKNTYPEEIW